MIDSFLKGNKNLRGLSLALLLFLSSALGAGAGLYLAPKVMLKPLTQAPLTEPGPSAASPIGTPAQFTANSPVVLIADQVGPTVVGVSAMTGKKFSGEGNIKQGSGVIFDGGKGYIVTNNHVIDGAGRIMVSFDREHIYPATVVGADKRSDLAVLRIEATDLPQARLGDSAAVQAGETVVAIGNPLGRQFARSVTVGVISALNREVAVPGPGGIEITLNTFQTDAPINPGNSGGALVNLRGEVIGINSVKIATAGVEGMGFAIPINDARPIIDQIIAYGRVTYPFLGIYNLREITAEMSQWYNIPSGVHIGGVFTDGPAADAGLQNGDIITAVDNNRVTTYGDIQQIISRKSPGQQVALTVSRPNVAGALNYIISMGELPQ